MAWTYWMGWGGKETMIKIKRNRAEARRGSFKMNLQFFAEGGDGAGAKGGNGGGSREVTEKNENLSFDEFLKGEGNQAEFDRRVNKAIETAIANAQEKWRVLTDDKLSEADKMARMTKEEKAQYMQQKRDKELTDREAAITKRELMAEAKNMLAEKNLPTELAGVLNYADADSCKKSIEAMEKAFQKAVQAAVEERLKGDKPPKKAREVTVTKEEYQKMGYSERLKLKTENPELYRQLSGR